MRLYIPGTVLQEGHNELVLLEMDTLPEKLQGGRGGRAEGYRGIQIHACVCYKHRPTCTPFLHNKTTFPSQQNHTVQLVDSPDFYGPGASMQVCCGVYQHLVNTMLHVDPLYHHPQSVVA